MAPAIDLRAGRADSIWLEVLAMCGRYQIEGDPRGWCQQVLPRMTSRIGGPMLARYNVAPSQDVPVIRGDAGGQEMVLMRWGFVPHWIREEKPKVQPINAKAETVAEKPFFREALQRRRCILPATGFYEWQVGEDGPKQPYLIKWREDRQKLYMAGIWDTWAGPDGPVDTVAILTCRANEMMAQIHDRMPVLLETRHLVDWLERWDPHLVEPVHRGQLEAWPISRKINNASQDDRNALELLQDRPARIQ